MILLSSEQRIPPVDVTSYDYSSICLFINSLTNYTIIILDLKHILICYDMITYAKSYSNLINKTDKLKVLKS